MLNKILRLERPLAVLDFETSGLDCKVDRVIQIGLTLHYVEKDPIRWTSLIKPGISVLNVNNHHITDQMLNSCSICEGLARDTLAEPVEGNGIYCKCPEFKPWPTFKQIAPALAPRITNVDIMGYHVEFDIGFMKWEMKRAEVDWSWNGHIIDPLHIYRMRHGHNLSNAYKRYVDPKGFEGAHDAGNDVIATEEVLMGQLREYTDLPRTVKELSAFCFPHPENAVDKTGKFVWIGEDAAFNFGKYRGKLLKDPKVRHYIQWLSTADFPDDVIDICLDCLDGKFPKKAD